MKIEDLPETGHCGIARIAGREPKVWAYRLLFGLALAVAMALMTGCDGPGLTDEQLESDPLPDFDDGIISGNWLLEGKLVTFETKDHAIYQFHQNSAESDEEDVVFKLKRAGTLLMMEYAIKAPSGQPLFRPCWVGVNRAAMELHCLQGGELATLGLQVEERKYDNDTVEVVTDSQERLKQFYVEQASNDKVFELTMKFTRPQPVLIARLLRKAQRGRAEAQEMLAEALTKGEIVERDEEEALKWARKAGDSGRPSAQVLAGNILMEKRTRVPPEAATELLHEAHAWYIRAAQRDYPEAFSRLGHLYESSVLEDDAAAVSSYERGVELGDTDSSAQLGVRYWLGQGVPQDEHKALTYLENVPEAGRDSTAWSALANIYLSSVDPELRDHKKAFDAAERMLVENRSCEAYALAAQAAFQLGEFETASRYQESAVCDGRDNVNEQRARLASYREAAASLSEVPDPATFTAPLSERP